MNFNQKGFANIVFIVVVVAVVALGGYFIFSKKLEPVAQQQTPTPTRTPVSPTPTRKMKLQIGKHIQIVNQCFHLITLRLGTNLKQPS